jgi:hypothetical protein
MIGAKLQAKLLEVFFLSMCLLMASQASLANETFPFKACFEMTAQKYGLDAALLAGIASVESSLNPNAVSTSDAIGLMQIKWPQTAIELGVQTRQDLFDPCLNIDAGGQYLSALKERFGSKLLALASYFEGPTKVSITGGIEDKSVRYIERVLREEQLIAALDELERFGDCDLGAFQSMAAETHHPKDRANRARLWVLDHHTFCSTPELLRIRNRLPELLGTADSKGEIRTLIDQIILEKSDSQKK